MDTISADVLVVGGGTGGTAAAIQAARRGQQSGLRVVLVSELPWLGGMLTSAGVCAPDGNELEAFQTGIWGAFLQELRCRHPGGLGNGWVSFFTYNPAIGAQIFADWVDTLPNLSWISGQRPREVLRSGDRITGIQFDQLTVHATITIDGTELGDILALGEVPYRWGWETRSIWDEPSAPVSLSDPSDPLYEITQRYPVQSPTWVAIMQDYQDAGAPKIERQIEHKIERPSTVQVEDDPPNSDLSNLFAGAWSNYGDQQTSAGQTFLNYGRLPDNLFMINWPHRGNDYGVGLHRLVESAAAREQYGKEAQRHTQAFAHYIQSQLGDRYGLATNIFPSTKASPGGGFALMPYYRESRRLKGLATISERDILPLPDAQTAALPLDERGEVCSIAMGNYPNDHHYPGFEMPLAPKAIRWGGRWTGTPFTIPYGALVPAATDGLLVCEKNISVSHIANGATRLQPVVLGIGQAAGMAAALCVEKNCSPRALAVRSLQTALISEPTMPAAIIPLFNLSPTNPQWKSLQKYYLDNPNTYLSSGNHPFDESAISAKLQNQSVSNQMRIVIGKFRKNGEDRYELHQNTAIDLPNRLILITVRSEITEIFQNTLTNRSVQILGTWNPAGEWMLCEQLVSQ
ncbi:FAD-dependent oxidoreductase [cf. Phormidesmis sp. LEGE 11477]|uniref:FAD-dependent oxidoreductase n=1 Tax=cf. Phormidesmis sp. LEGE 11477 TaxID=1828680 RepID=UPI0018802F10|nr:FAD-dependent oxidoreductase [cf. Phormidesmis sp. LEGE 11477]MBE9061134.1 FAD-dependent oxidoreductase [cf. Phormidesmis sp. LEGE 11477]